MKPLTEREHETMQLLCLGYSNKGAAEYLGISVKTLEKHRNAIYYKWSVDSITALIRAALRSGEFTLTDFLNSRIGEDSVRQAPQTMLQ